MRHEQVRGRIALTRGLFLARVERQHALIETLRAALPRSLTGSQLADRLCVSRRTIERDVADLVDAGVPIRVRRGVGGGYRINAPSALEPVAFTAGEAAAVIASMVAVGPYVAATAQSALAKVVAVFDQPTPPVARRQRPVQPGPHQGRRWS